MNGQEAGPRVGYGFMPMPAYIRLRSQRWRVIRGNNGLALTGMLSHTGTAWLARLGVIVVRMHTGHRMPGKRPGKGGGQSARKPKQGKP